MRNGNGVKGQIKMPRDVQSTTFNDSAKKIQKIHGGDENMILLTYHVHHQMIS